MIRRIVTCVCSAGVSLAYGAMPALIIGAVPTSETGSANSFNTLMRSVGTSVSAAVVGLVPLHMTNNFGGHAVASLGGFRTECCSAASSPSWPRPSP